MAVFATGTAATLAAALGWFRWFAPLIIAAWGLVFILLLWTAAKQRFVWRGNRVDLLGIAVCISGALAAGIFHHVFFQGQMDTGFYQNDAFLIATTGGRNLAANSADHLLPGFAPHGDSTFRAGVMFGYSSLAALFVYLWGYWANPLVNVPLVFVTLAAMYAVARKIASSWGAVGGLVAYQLSFVSMWLSRWQMSENAATAAFWLMALLVMRQLGAWSQSNVYMLAVAGLFGALVRPEGFALSLWAFIVTAAAYWRQRTPKPTASNDHLRRLRRNLGVATACVVLAFAIVIPSLPSQYLEHNWVNAKRLLTDGVIGDAPDVPTSGPGPHWGDYALRYQWDSATQYAYHWLLAAALVGLAFGVVDRRRSAWLALLALPYAVFIFMPPVTPFHPWFMRRLWVALIPLVMILGAGTIGHVLAKGAIVLPGWLRRVKAAAVASRIAAGAVAIALLLTLADQGAPFFFHREDDGSPEVASWVSGIVPNGSCLLADQDVVGFGVPLRFTNNLSVVPYFEQIPAAFLQSFITADETAGCYLLRLTTDFPWALGTDSQGSELRRDLEIKFSAAPRQNLRPYLQSAPLKEGYAPLAAYLEAQVPPKGMLDLRVGLTLLKLSAPMILVKGVEIEEKHWVRTPDGLQAIQDDARIRIPLETFSSLGVNQTGLAVTIIRPEEAPWSGMWAGDEFWPPSPSRIEAGYVLETRHVVAPVVLDELRFPEGAVIRGIMVA